MSMENTVSISICDDGPNTHVFELLGDICDTYIHSVDIQTGQ